MDDLEKNNEKKWEEIERWKKRCIAASTLVQQLPLSKITLSCKQTLLRLLNSELKFLTRSHHSSFPSISVNIGYLESIVHILQQPYILGITRVCKAVPLSSGHRENNDLHPKRIHIDIICTLNKTPVWFLVSDRNSKYIAWSTSQGKKGLKARIQQVLMAAQSCSTLKPALIILFFSSGLDRDVSQKLRDEFGASELRNEFSFLDCGFSEELDNGWVNVVARSYGNAQIFQIMVDTMERRIPRLDNGVCPTYVGAARPEMYEIQSHLQLGDRFSSLVLSMKLSSLDVKFPEPEALLGEDLLNFDTTALIALVSGISNGGSEKLLAASESEMRKRFKSNFEFVIAQVNSELQNPILDGLTCVISGKIGMICESVRLEFKELVSMCAGSNEKLRADLLLKCLMTVPDCPSARISGIPTTRKLALKNKVIFGTGDRWYAPTLTANMGFVRAISQTGMSLLTLEHRPRALIGE